MKLFTNTVCFAGLWLVLANVVSTARAETEIKLRERVECRSSVVRLADVADISSNGDDEMAKLGALPLMPAPAPGTERHLRKREVQDLLAAHGLDLAQFRFRGAEDMAIMSPTSIGNSANNQAPVPERAFTGNRHAAALAGGGHAFREVRLDASRGDRLREQFNFIISDYIDAKTGQAGAYRVKCDISERYLIQLNSATSQPVCQGGTAPWTGRQKFVVSFSTPAGTASVPVYAEVVAKAVPVVVAIRPVARGEVITASHLELRSADNVPPATQSRAAIQMLEQVVGLEARQPIQEGEMIFTDQVAEPQLVKRGELVTVVAAGGGIKVKTTARARQDGARGKIVQVETLDSRERFDARVTGPRETAVFTPALPQPQIATKETTAARR